MFNKKETNINIEENVAEEATAAEKAPETRKRRHSKRLKVLAVVIGVLACAVGGGLFYVSATAPYAVAINGNTVCYVEDKDGVSRMAQSVIEEYLPEDTTLNVVEVSDNITADKADLKNALTAECVSIDRAATLLRDRLENPGEYDAAVAPVKTSKKHGLFGTPVFAESEEGSAEEPAGDPAITILSTGMVTETFKLPVEYIKDDSMLAGDAVVEEKGCKGKKEVLRQYTTVNGEVTDEDDLEVTVIKEAKAKVIRKGTLGLPEGEDWKTYDGDPIFNDGEALTKTALKYLGAPYKYGGYSLTTGIDCVQFIRQMYAKYGIKLPNGKNALKHVGTSVSFANAKPGDIICYPHHYAIYLGGNKIVHATSKGGVKVRNNAHFMKIVTIRRIPRS